MVKQPDTRTTHYLRWYVVACKPNSAETAIRNLQNQNFGTFMPLQETTKRKGKIFQRQIRPLFPGYIFVQLNPGQGPWRQVNSTRGVARLVRLGAEPSVVPNSIVEALMVQCNEQSVLCQTSDTRSSQLPANSQAQVTNGPFSGFVATIASIEANDRINVLIQIMGQRTKVAIDASALQPINWVGKIKAS